MSPDDTPGLIPRRVAYAALAGVLYERARVLRGRTPQSTGRRRGPLAAELAAQKAAGRQASASQYEASARALAYLSCNPDACRGDGVDAAVLGWLIALAHDMVGSAGELRAELLEVGWSAAQVASLRGGSGLLDTIRAVVSGKGGESGQVGSG